MKIFLLASLCFSVVCASCQPASSSAARYYEYGKAKPAVCWLPAVNQIEHPMPWDVSDEIACGVQSRISKAGKLYFSSSNQSIILRAYDQTSLQQLKQKYPTQDFIVQIQLLEHTQMPCTNASVPLPASPVATVEMQCRLSIIDLRTEAPKILLQQILVQHYPVCAAQQAIDYTVRGWQQKGYCSTPWAHLHNRMEKEIVHRIEQYIYLACK